MSKLGKIQRLAIISLAAVALATPIALAQNSNTDQGGDRSASRGEGRGHRGGKRGGRGHFGGRGFRGLDLTDDQQARMQQIRQSFGERTRGLREQLRAKRQEIRQANDGGTFNEALATQKLTEAATLEAKLMGEEFRLRQEMLSVLTPEQRPQMEQKRAEFEAKRGERRGRRQGRPQTQQQWQ